MVALARGITFPCHKAAAKNSHNPTQGLYALEHIFSIASIRDECRGGSWTMSQDPAWGLRLTIVRL